MTESELIPPTSGRALIRVYPSRPLRARALWHLTVSGGGEPYSATLSRVLANCRDVVAGEYSNGSPLDAGVSHPPLWVGQYVSISPAVRLFWAKHPMAALSNHPLWSRLDAAMEQDALDAQRSHCGVHSEVWISAGCITLPGCRLTGIGSEVGAGSVNTGEIPDFSITADNPCRIIRQHLPDEVRQRLVRLCPWGLARRNSKMLYAVLAQAGWHRDDRGRAGP